LLSEIIVQEPRVSLVPKLKHYLRTINVFSDTPPSTDELDIQNERIATKLYFILLVLSTSVLITYTSLIDVTKTTDDNSPTLAQYSYLYSKHSETLICPCKNISIKYDEFFQINYTLHEVCSSIFVSNDWIAHLAGHLDKREFAPDDFRSLGTYTFQALKLFCQSSKKTISDSLTRFYSNEYATLSVTSEELFQSQSHLLMDQFISSTINDFLLSLQIIQDTTQANALYFASQRHFMLLKDPETRTVISLLRKYNDCDCSSAEKCVQQSGIKADSHSISLFDVPGQYAGCSTIKALLQSTLECFYNQTCINTLQLYMENPASVNATALDLSLLIRHNESSTIQELVNHLMIEDWNLSSVYENFYKECQPIKCTYIHVTKNDEIYIVTTVFGLIGGLITVLKFVTPRLVKITRGYSRSRRLETGKNPKMCVLFSSE
jgi:hypothetical protein